MARPSGRELGLDHSWLIPGRLGAGAWPGAHLDWLARRGVSVLINLTHHAYRDDRFRIHRIPVQDRAVPGAAQIREFCGLVDDALARQETIYVHCLAGCGRTGTMIACYLVYRDRLDPIVAIDHVRGVRPCSVETQAQAEAVSQWSVLMQATGYRLATL